MLGKIGAGHQKQQGREKDGLLGTFCRLQHGFHIAYVIVEKEQYMEKGSECQRCPLEIDVLDHHAGGGNPHHVQEQITQHR